MICYFRHLETVLKKAGITVTPENRQKLDGVIHGLVGANYKGLPKRLATSKTAFSG